MAQYNLGTMYDNGAGVPQEHAGAVRWFRRAAEQGCADAQHNLGGMYANGAGVRRGGAAGSGSFEFGWRTKAVYG